MNVFEEFNRLVKELETRKVKYALVGGVAAAFYTEPRFTKDIDLLIDFEDYEKLVKELTDEESVYVKFVIEIQTNSTLPMDKQSLANLFLRLAELQITENSPIDIKTLLEMLHVPKVDEILKRLKDQRTEKMQKAAQAQQPMQAMLGG